MLTEKDFNAIEKQAIKLYGDLELEIIQEIAERIVSVGYANTVVYNDVAILEELGVLREDVINMVAKYNETSASQIKDIFETAGVKSLKRDDSIYKLAGLNPKGLNKSMQQLVAATAKKTHNNLSNLTMTTANTSQMQFLNAMNKAYLEVSSGTKSYSQSIIDTIKDISKQGAYIEYPSRQHRSIESAIRTNILTSINQTSGKLQEMRAEEMGWDLVEVSAHGGARPEHADWQGKVYSLRGETKGYKTLEEGCDYGKVTGLCGVNCRHTFFPFYKGSTRTYTDNELYELKNEKVKYNGQQISQYEASQIQRKMERNIRQDQKNIAGLQGVLKGNIQDEKLLEDTRTEFAKKSLIYKDHQNKLNDFILQTSLKKDNTRLFVANKYDKKISAQISQVTKIANKYNNSDIIGTKVNGVEIKEIGEHIISRTYARGLKFEDVEDALKNPLDYGKMKEDKQGRKSFSAIGEKITVYINPENGKITTTHATSSKKAKKLKEKKDENNKKTQ